MGKALKKPPLDPPKPGVRVNWTIHPKGTLLLRVEQGTAVLGKKRYELCTALNGAPLIKSEQTGKTFSLTWHALLDMAREAGVDLE